MNCVEGRGFTFDCPEGLAFNEESYRCDWPDQVPSCDPECKFEQRPKNNQQLIPNFQRTLDLVVRQKLRLWAKQNTATSARRAIVRGTSFA